MVDKATQAASTDDNAAVHIAHAAIIQVQRKLIAAIAATGSGPNDRYADLRSRCRSPAAYQLVVRIREEIEELERKTGTRTRKRRAKSAAKFSEATERFMGDLLRARAGGVATSRIFRATGKDSFANDPVKYAAELSRGSSVELPIVFRRVLRGSPRPHRTHDPVDHQGRDDAQEQNNEQFH